MDTVRILKKGFFNAAMMAMACLYFAVIITGCEKIHTIEGERHEVISFRATPFELNQVTLLDGPFKHATELNRQTLLNYQPDRLLARFRSEAGLQPKAEHYGGWESNTIAGHSLGHHLSACALMFQSTGDERFRERAQYIVDELDSCQRADGDGYIGAFPDGKKILQEQVARGDIRAQGFDLNGIWVPFYTQHKVLAGLRDAYRLCGIEKALQIERTFADWLATVVADLDDARIQEMLRCEHGGINEVLADLYADTGERKYLDLSRLFYHRAVLDSLAAGIDILPNLHANTQIPKLIGLARIYELTGDAKTKRTAEFFWDRVAHHHSYVTGGHGNHEYFGRPDELAHRLSDETTETCNVYNMLKLTGHLFQWDARAELADFYERALFNHILSSQHPQSGRVVYNLSLEMGGHKGYQDPEWFTCCIGTAMESHSKYGGAIFYHNEAELYVAQFIAATANWEEKGVRVHQRTDFPQEHGTHLDIMTEKPQRFTLFIRYPYWAQNGMSVVVNGEKQSVKNEPGSFVGIRRKWLDGDQVDVQFPFSLRLEAMPDDSTRAAVLYGPLVLAGDLGAVDDARAHNSDFVPALVTEEREPHQWLAPVPDTLNTFRLAGIGVPRDVTLMPFYTLHDRRYSVYWDIFTQESYRQRQEAQRQEVQRRRELEAKTYDFFQPGDDQSERRRHINGERLERFDFKGRQACSADRGGWLSFEMNVMPDQPMRLVVDYWGGFTGSRTFDILADDILVATENIAGKRDGAFIDISYDIPDSLTQNKKTVKILFRPHDGHRAGPFFGARTLRKE
ncbi:glycoside hydrolase family 127 protein [candidate division KSB1 bacterium]|nr:glycoside hydrolase family 127 protein [candidate division KSB1 bacterium]